MIESIDKAKDKGERWLLIQQAGSILKLAGISGFTGWTVEESSLIAPRRLPDGFVRVTFPDRKEPVPFIIEIESYSESDADRQMYEALLLARLELGVIPEGICVMLRPKSKARATGRYEGVSQLESTHVNGSWRVVELWTLKAKDLLAQNDVGLVPWVPLTQIDGPAEPVLRQCKERIDRDVPAAQREAFSVVTAILAEMIHPIELLQTIFTEGKQMIDLPIFTTLEAQATHKVLLRVLEARFGNVPETVRQTLRQVFNVESLARLSDLAGTCADLDEFESVLRTVPADQPRPDSP